MDNMSRTYTAMVPGCFTPGQSETFKITDLKSLNKTLSAIKDLDSLQQELEEQAQQAEQEITALEQYKTQLEALSLSMKCIETNVDLYTLPADRIKLEQIHQQLDDLYNTLCNFNRTEYPYLALEELDGIVQNFSQIKASYEQIEFKSKAVEQINCQLEQINYQFDHKKQLSNTNITATILRNLKQSGIDETTHSTESIAAIESQLQACAKLLRKTLSLAINTYRNQQEMYGASLEDINFTIKILEQACGEYYKFHKQNNHNPLTPEEYRIGFYKQLENLFSEQLKSMAKQVKILACNKKPVAGIMGNKDLDSDSMLNIYHHIAYKINDPFNSNFGDIYDCFKLTLNLVRELVQYPQRSQLNLEKLNKAIEGLSYLKKKNTHMLSISLEQRILGLKKQTDTQLEQLKQQRDDLLAHIQEGTNMKKVEWFKETVILTADDKDTEQENLHYRSEEKIKYLEQKLQEQEAKIKKLESTNTELLEIIVNYDAFLM